MLKEPFSYIGAVNQFGDHTRHRSSLDTGMISITDPIITLYADQYLLDDFNDDLENSIRDDNWQDTLRRDSLEYWELALTHTGEAALVTYLRSGAYTAPLSLNGGSGTGVVEVYIAPLDLLPEQD